MKKAFSGQVGLKVVEAELVDEAVDAIEALDAVVAANVVEAVFAGTVVVGALTTVVTDAAGTLLLAILCEADPDCTDPLCTPEAAVALTTAATGICAETVVLVVTVVVVVVPTTHFPPLKMNPNLLEQVLQATPPSL